MEEREDGFRSQFHQFKQSLDLKYERREKIIRASKDLTKSAKNLIFELHRTAFEENAVTPDKISQAVLGHLAQLEIEIAHDEALSFHGQGGLEEFVEALSFEGFLRRQSIMSHQDFLVLSPLVTPQIYLLGLCDLTGEMMRYAVAALGKGAQVQSTLAYKTVHDIYRLLLPIQCHLHNPSKMKVMQESLNKMFHGQYGLALRMVEFRDQPELLKMALKKLGEQQGEEQETIQSTQPS